MVTNPAEPVLDLARVVAELATLLPAQGPISVFIHHNPLHHFETASFEEAVVNAGVELGCEPFLLEDRYRTELARGRIAEADVDAVLTSDLGDRALEPVFATISRYELRRRIALHGVPEARGEALSWLLAETRVLERYRQDLPADARELTASGAAAPDELDDESDAVRALWHASLAAVRRAPRLRATTSEPPPVRRHRDLLLAAYGVDTDEWVHPVLIRFVSAYLDQGLAHWPMAGRERGMYACFHDHHSLSGFRERWARELPRLVRDDWAAGGTSLMSLQRSLEAIGVPCEEWYDFLAPTVLALRGWAGMVRQIEERPDRVPAYPVPATLADFLAVRLLLERVALAYVARTYGHFDGSLASLRPHLRTRLGREQAITEEERAWPIFHVAQLHGLSASAIDQVSADEVARLESELREFDGVERRRLLHLAYERHLRNRVYDALVQHAPYQHAEEPDVQAIFCIDEREESFRRHLEEVDRGVETFGAAGFFGVAIYYQGASDAHPRPLCPVTIRPEHYVAERDLPAPNGKLRWGRIRRRAGGQVEKAVHLGSRTLARGALLAVLLGPLSIVPLVLRVIFPWLSQRLDRSRLVPAHERPTELSLERSAAIPPIGRFSGFTVEEMTTIVSTLLENMGAAHRLSPLVVVVGHGSTSLNNPHESAHDCGACGGGRGGPNARAFAQMANDARVRERLALEGLTLPHTVWFVGAERNSANNAVTFFDTDRVPGALRPLLERVRASFDRVRELEAHERCRRFEIVPAWFPPRASLMHVEARSADLAQPRPEYGHATNAFCVVGTRRRTRGLFLDRRAFLVSYEPEGDAEGLVLDRLLAAVVPVVAGISLEYYFGYVDPTGYGSGTKLPHNVTCLLGVMDGAQSDLRTGLPWQMLEIHEPVRLTLIVECPRERLRRILARNDYLRRLVENRWIYLASLEPDAADLWQWTPAGYQRHQVEHPLSVIRGRSADWYRGKRGHLPFAEIRAVASEGVDA